MQISKQLKNTTLTTIVGQSWEPFLYTGSMPASPTSALTGGQVFNTGAAYIATFGLLGDPITENQVVTLAPSPVSIGPATGSGVPGYMRLVGSSGATHVMDMAVSSDGLNPVKSSGVSYVVGETTGTFASLSISTIGSNTYVAPANLKRKFSSELLKAMLNDAVANLNELTLYTGAAPGPDNPATGVALASSSTTGGLVTWSAPATTGTEGGFITSATFPQLTPQAVGTVGYARLQDGMGQFAIDLVVGTDIKLSRTTITQAQVDAGTALTVSTLGTGLPRFALTITPTNFGAGGTGPYLPCPVIYDGGLNVVNLSADNTVAVGGIEVAKNADIHIKDLDPPVLAAYNYKHRRILETGGAIPRSRQSGISNLILGESTLSNYALVLEQFDGTAAYHAWTGAEWKPVIPRLWDGARWVKRLPVLAKKK